MKITKRQRAQVVELLRCAADLVGRTVVPVAEACGVICDDDPRLFWVAMDIHDQLTGRPLILLNDLRHSACLEAAQLVEEGLWP